MDDASPPPVPPPAVGPDLAPPLPPLSAPIPPPIPQWYGAWPAPAPRRVWPVFVAYAILFAGMFFIAMAAFAVWFVVRGEVGLGAEQSNIDASVEEALQTPAFSLSLLMGIALLGGGIAVSGAALSPRPLVERLSIGASPAGLGTYAAVILGTLAISHGTISLVALLELTPSQAVEGLDRTITSLHGLQILGGIIVIGLGAGVCEELFFRGYVQTRLVERWGLPTALVITAAMFGLLHLDLIQSPFTFCMGLFIGWVAWRARSIRPAIAAHVLNNSVVVLWAVWVSGESAPGPLEAEVRTALLVVVLICVAVLIASILAIRRILPPRAHEDLPMASLAPAALAPAALAPSAPPPPTPPTMSI